MKKIYENIPEDAFQNKKDYRDRIDLLRSRAEQLVGRDRLLIKMYLDNGNSFRQMARLAQVNETQISRKIHKIIQRLINSEYIMFLRNRDKFRPIEMEIAKNYFLRGMSIRKIATTQKVTYYLVRQTLKKIQGIVRVEKKV